MRGDEALVAGQVTGKWRVICAKCRKLHMKESSILRCGQSLTNAIMGGVMVQIRPPSLRMNPYFAVKKGMGAEYLEVSESIEELQDSRNMEFCVSTNGFAKAEDEIEATQVILNELVEFAVARRDGFAKIYEKIVEFTKKASASDCARVKSVGLGSDRQLKIDGVEIAVTDLIDYYFILAPIRLTQKDNHDPLENGQPSWYLNTYYADPNEDKFIFSGSNGGPTKYYGLKPVNEIMRLWRLKPSLGTSKELLKSQLDTATPA